MSTKRTGWTRWRFEKYHCLNSGYPTKIQPLECIESRCFVSPIMLPCPQLLPCNTKFFILLYPNVLLINSTYYYTLNISYNFLSCGNYWYFEHLCPFGGGTMSTVIWALCKTCSLTLPSTVRLIVPRPRWPITMHLTCFPYATSHIVCPTLSLFSTMYVLCAMPLAYKFLETGQQLQHFSSVLLWDTLSGNHARKIQVGILREIHRLGL